MLLSSRRYLYSKGCGEMRSLQIFLGVDLLALFTAAQNNGSRFCESPPISTLLISTELVSERTLENDLSLTAYQRNSRLKLTYGLPLWTKPALIEIARQSAIVLHAWSLANEIISGVSLALRLQMDLQMRLDWPSSSTTPEASPSVPSRTE